MYSPNLTTLMKMLEEDQRLKEIQTPEATQSDKETDDLPFSLFPSSNKTPISNKTKVLLVSDHCQSYTCNSKVSWNLLKALSKQPELEVFHFGMNIHPNSTADHRPYPSKIGFYSVNEIVEDRYGVKNLNSYVDKIKPTVVIFFHMFETIETYVKGLESCSYKAYKTVIYIDLVYYNVCKEHIDKLNSIGDKIYVNSEYYRQKLLEGGIKKPIDLLSVGFDRSQAPILDKTVARYKINIPESGFTILAPFDNVPKHRYDIIIKAYAKLITRYPDVEMRLFCMCNKSEVGGYPIIDMYKQEIKNNGSSLDLHAGKIMLIDKKQVFTDEVKNVIYNAVDVGICVSESAHLNMSPLDMLFVGVPLIISDSNPYSKYANKNNSVILKTASSYLANNGKGGILSEVGVVNSEDLFLALEACIKNPKSLTEKRGSIHDDFPEWSFTNLVQYLTTC